MLCPFAFDSVLTAKEMSTPTIGFNRNADIAAFTRSAPLSIDELTTQIEKTQIRLSYTATAFCQDAQARSQKCWQVSADPKCLPR